MEVVEGKDVATQGELVDASFILDAQCNRCGHKWKTRVIEPKQCPKCHSPYWNKPRIRPLAR